MQKILNYQSEKYFQVYGNVFDLLTTVSIRTRIFTYAIQIPNLRHSSGLLRISPGRSLVRVIGKVVRKGN